MTDKSIENQDFNNLPWNEGDNVCATEVMAWFKESLETTAKNISKEWIVSILSHKDTKEDLSELISETIAESPKLSFMQFKKYSYELDKLACEICDGFITNFMECVGFEHEQAIDIMKNSGNREWG